MEDIPSIIEVGFKIECIKELKTFCNNEEKVIFKKGLIYSVIENNQFPCIYINNSKKGYTFFDNSKDDYFRIASVPENLNITKDNIHLYYEFMSDEDIKTYKDILRPIFSDRYNNIKNFLTKEGLIVETEKGLDCDILHNNYKSRTFDTLVTNYYEIFYFKIKDTLKPIDEYIKEIKASSHYKEYIFSLYSHYYDSNEHNTEFYLNDSLIFERVGCLDADECREIIEEYISTK